MAATDGLLQHGPTTLSPAVIRGASGLDCRCRSARAPTNWKVLFDLAWLRSPFVALALRRQAPPAPVHGHAAHMVAPPTPAGSPLGAAPAATPAPEGTVGRGTTRAAGRRNGLGSMAAGSPSSRLSGPRPGHNLLVCRRPPRDHRVLSIASARRLCSQPCPHRPAALSLTLPQCHAGRVSSGGSGSSQFYEALVPRAEQQQRPSSSGSLGRSPVKGGKQQANRRKSGSELQVSAARTTCPHQQPRLLWLP